MKLLIDSPFIVNEGSTYFAKYYLGFQGRNIDYYMSYVIHNGFINIIMNITPNIL